MSFRGLILVLGIFLLSAVSYDSIAGTIPMPEIPKAMGDPNFHGDFQIRKNHMIPMMHKRDETMQQGVRSSRDSLKACFACHGVKDDAGEFVSYKEPQHFCRVCHDYAAVKVDCFECHSSLPDPSITIEMIEEEAGK